MQNEGLNKFNLWLEKRLSYPGCTERQLQGNITVFENQIFLAAFTLIGGLIVLIFNPQVTIFMQYLFAFSGLYVLSLLMQLLFPIRYMLIQICVNILMHLLTFYYVVRLGGIPTSGGIVFAGISNVIATIPRQKTWLPVLMFSIFSVWVTIVMFLKPWLHVPDQMTPSLNSLFWMISSIILTGGALAFVLRFIRQQKKLEELEATHLKELNEFKDRFFTNITHEFRTPLTIIDGMANLVESQPEQWTHTGLQKIKSNSRILLRLVNQMLNLARNEAGAISVNLVRKDVNKYIAYLAEQFDSEALRKKVDLRFVSSGEPFEMDFDPEKLMYIITNLISNALKYTPEGGQIEVVTGTRENGSIFSIQVKDTGIGIDNEHLDHLFDRFYRVEHQLSPGSTGIGLALTKEMVQLLNGTISVKSTKGEGTGFTVLLPVTRNAPSSDILEMEDLIKVTDDQYDMVSSSGESMNLVQPPEETITARSFVPAELPLLLIVEDSPDVALYLEAILKYEYRIKIAVNGRIGIEKALEIVPDIILSDVMMPVMDGIELLVKVKNDIRTSHIPVVLLTAKADIDSRLEGLDRGADAYLAKPVDERELHIQLKNLITQRKKLHERYASLENIPDTSDKFLKMEDGFMKKIRQLMEANLGDEEFGISHICNELAVSHAQLYRKFKSLSNITIADYFKLLRLNKAKELLLTTDRNVTEVAYSVGFKSLPHFSREFTRKFGRPPSELRK